MHRKEGYKKIRVIGIKPEKLNNYGPMDMAYYLWSLSVSQQITCDFNIVSGLKIGGISTV